MTQPSVLQLTLPEIKDLVLARDWLALRQFLADVNPVDLADGWHLLTPAEQVILFRLLPRRSLKIGQQALRHCNRRL